MYGINRNARKTSEPGKPFLAHIQCQV